MEHKTTVYIGLGGNVGDSFGILNKTLQEIVQLEQIDDVEASRFYLSSPVGNESQNFFTNAVCRFETSLNPKDLLRKMQRLETALGKTPKPKDAPRPIDIDILFYGSDYYKDEELEIPHPAWKSRLFVLVPLTDLTSTIQLVSSDKKDHFILHDLIESVERSSRQSVFFIG